MGTIKDRTGMHLTEAEDTKMRWQEYTEEFTKKIFEPDILDCEVKLALGSITTKQT